MMDEAPARESVAPSRKRAGRKRLRLLLGFIFLLLIVFLVPPWVSIGRYKSRIAQVLSTSVGRPVQISSVELRLLPWPGFVMTNLSVAEDPAYGVEPVLHANAVRANIRLLSLWRGRLEISGIRVDEASLNIVRAGPGQWNLDPLFRTAAAKAGAPVRSGRAVPWPSLEATNSRINIKNGAEKLPFSLVNTDLSFSQDDPGTWRVRVRGEPARTDVAFDSGDTGIVRIEASMKRAPTLSQMPVTLDLDWSEAQLGQLSRLLIGSDPGWRGDLTGELHLLGTADAAHITTRLRAAGVHRAEFAPATPIDFDANCALVYNYSQRSMEDLSCDSPLGNGRIKVTGGKPGADQAAHLTVVLDRIPVAAGLDLLRTLRSGLAPDVEAAGTVSGRIDYAGQDAGQAAVLKPARRAMVAQQRGPLSGSLTVEGFALSSGALGTPLQAPKVVLQPVQVTDGAAPPFEALEGTAAFAAGAPSPLNVNVRLHATGYEATLRGQAAIARAREMAQTAGWAQADALRGLAGDPVVVNVTAAGPWLPAQDIATESGPAAAGASVAALASAASLGMQVRPVNDSVMGTIALRNANWKADYLTGPVQITQATLRLEEAAMRWDTVSFSYGPVKGTASVTIPLHCAAPATGAAQAQPACSPQFHVQFADLDASVLEAALLGAREKGTLLSDLIARLHPAAAPAWPALQGSMNADTLKLGPVTFQKASAAVAFAADHADFSALQGTLLGGQIAGSGTISWTGDAPSYTVEADCDGLSAAAVGQLLGQHWSGGPMGVDGKVELTGFTDKDLAASAKGTLHFEWRHGGAAAGSVLVKTARGAKAAPVASVLARFDDWTGDAQIGDGAVTLGQNQAVMGRRKLAVEGAVTFGVPPKVRLGAAKPSQQK